MINANILLRNLNLMFLPIILILDNLFPFFPLVDSNHLTHKAFRPLGHKW